MTRSGEPNRVADPIDAREVGRLGGNETLLKPIVWETPSEGRLVTTHRQITRSTDRVKNLVLTSRRKKLASVFPRYLRRLALPKRRSGPQSLKSAERCFNPSYRSCAGRPVSPIWSATPPLVFASIRTMFCPQ